MAAPGEALSKHLQQAAPEGASPRLPASFDLASLRAAIRDGAHPAEIVKEAYRRIRADARSGVWISLRDEEEAIGLAKQAAASPAALPLAGIPFAVKDNIDVADLATTAACPAFSYTPDQSAGVVSRLEAAGAVCIGKTNLDQFATGISGTRSPFGVCGAAHDPRFVAGGSSAGSAVATALHQVAFALGTDTGGSGRVPAGLNGVVGLKPTPRVLSMRGVVPNCRTLDCVSVFALTVDDALEIADIAYANDSADASLRDDADRAHFKYAAGRKPLVIAVPRKSDREFFGNQAGSALFDEALHALEQSGVQLQPIDFTPFIECGQLLFEGPWIAERSTSFGAFAEQHADDVLPVIHKLLSRARGWSATDAFEAFYRRGSIAASVRTLLADIDAVVVPTVAPLYTVDEVLAEPIVRNDHLGRYSYFANLLDLCAVSVPSGNYINGMPFGVTFLGPAFSDGRIARIAARFHASRNLPLGVPRAPP